MHELLGASSFMVPVAAGPRAVWAPPLGYARIHDQLAVLVAKPDGVRAELADARLDALGLRKLLAQAHRRTSASDR
eukprot:3901635-Pyramimonas_sp.AAC.1